MEENMQESAPRGTSTLDTVAQWILLVVIFLLPFFFIPSLVFPFQLTKTTLFTIGVIVSLVLWAVARLKDGIIEIPRHPIFLAGMGILLFYLVSSLFSGEHMTSLVGSGTEIDTFIMILTLFLFLFLIPLLFKKKEDMVRILFAFFASFVVLAVVQIIRLFSGGAITFSVLGIQVSNALGKWNDLGIFFGLSAFLSLSVLGLLPLHKILKGFFSVVLIVSLFFLSVVGFELVWIVLGLISLVFFIYSFSFEKTRYRENTEDVGGEKRGRRIQWSATSLIVFIISLVFLFSGGSLSDSISGSFNVAEIEARPSWNSTLGVAGTVLKEYPLLGAGPNRFSRIWLEHKPPAVNNTVFWNADFNAGVGFIPSTLVTVGILGSLAWAAFLLLFLYTGIIGLISLRGEQNRLTSFLSVSSFLAALFLWVFMIAYVPGSVIVILAFLFTGIFLTLLKDRGLMRTRKFTFDTNPRAGFISVLGITLILIGAISWGYFVSERYIAAYSFMRGNLALASGKSLDSVERHIVNALSLYENDSYYRLLARLGIARLNQIAASTEGTEETRRNQFQTVLADAIGNARRSTVMRPKEYANWVVLGEVYEAIVPLGVDGAYESAMGAYENARVLNPTNPAVVLRLGRLERANGNNTGAREFIDESIRLKSNFVDAFILLAQIEADAGDVPAAIVSIERATLQLPNDPTLFFQLGVLRYSEGDYEEAIAALERAAGLNPLYANARYFLGLSYEREGRVEDAIEQFEVVLGLNPDSEEVQTIIQNLHEGREPFAN